jgi:hypothetical protein
VYLTRHYSPFAPPHQPRAAGAGHVTAKAKLAVTPVRGWLSAQTEVGVESGAPQMIGYSRDAIVASIDRRWDRTSKVRLARYHAHVRACQYVTVLRIQRSWHPMGKTQFPGGHGAKKKVSGACVCDCRTWWTFCRDPRGPCRSSVEKGCKIKLPDFDWTVVSKFACANQYIGSQVENERCMGFKAFI